MAKQVIIVVEGGVVRNILSNMESSDINFLVNDLDEEQPYVVESIYDVDEVAEIAASIEY